MYCNDRVRKNDKRFSIDHIFRKCNRIKQRELYQRDPQDIRRDIISAENIEMILRKEVPTEAPFFG